MKTDFDVISWCMAGLTLLLEYLQNHAAAISCLFLGFTFFSSLIFKYLTYKRDGRINNEVIATLKDNVERLNEESRTNRNRD